MKENNNKPYVAKITKLKSLLNYKNKELYFTMLNRVP